MALAPRLPLVIAIVAAGISVPHLEPAAVAAGLDAKAKADLKQATRLYRRGQYEESANLLADLVVDHPEMMILLRHLGACYYYLRRPEPAVSNLRDYLARKKGTVTDEDKQEVDRWIDEMEKLRAENAAAQEAPPPPEPVTPSQPTSVSSAPPFPAPSPAPAPAPTAPTTNWPPPAPAPYPAPDIPVPSASSERPAQAQPLQSTPTSDVPAAGEQLPASAGPFRPKEEHREEHEEEHEEPFQDPDASPAFRRGLLFTPYAGVQLPIHTVGWISTGYRFGIVLGGRLSQNVSLSGEGAFATWKYQPQDYRAAQFDFSVSLLRHVGFSWGEFITGPKLGWSMIRRNNLASSSAAYINGMQIGYRIGQLFALSSSAALGVLADATYIRSLVGSSDNCGHYTVYGWAGVDCTDLGNTVLGSVAAALLF